MTFYKNIVKNCHKKIYIIIVTNLFYYVIIIYYIYYINKIKN